MQQFRNIASRALGVALDFPPDYGSTLDAAPPIAGALFLHFPSKKGVFYYDGSLFSFTREEDNFHIFYHFYRHPPRGGFPGRGVFGC
jgi:hypothetical protein